MRVLFFSRGFTPHDRRFLEKMATWRHEVSFLMLEEAEGFDPGRMLPRRVTYAGSLGARGGDVTPAGPDHLVTRFREVCGEVKPDLVHAGPVQSCGFLPAAAGFHPLLLMSWGSDLLRDAGIDERWERTTRFTLRASDWLLCDCETVRARAKELAPCDDSRIIVFPWGVDLAKFRPSPGASPLRERLGWEDHPVVLSTRMWEPVYGIDTLLDAFRLASAGIPGLRLILLGGGSLDTRVRGYIRDHGLDERVVMPGIVDESEMPGYFHAADLYLSCSLCDGSSVSLLQAMACGLPVLVTDIPGNREWVTGGRNGLLARAGNGEEFAGGIGRAFRFSPPERREMARMNRRIAEKRADWDKNILLLRAAYDGIGKAHGK